MPRPIVRLLAAALLLVAGCAHALAQVARPGGRRRGPHPRQLPHARRRGAELAGIAIGSPLESGSVEAAADRLRRSGRFEAVDVRKRYRSLDDMTQVAIIIA